MAKLVDALVSGTSVSDDVQVRVLFWAQSKAQRLEGTKVLRQESQKYLGSFNGKNYN
jgi:hypothetical protein